ncbi:RhoGAP-domain-containing protein [Daedalea quercina L-15889]|uniref:RhoGAP-domain-containing protein n=1 Tax=Daedalea quercina L-15889 TaxID=1314783 RepID=A0A165RR04_9APHY|nr:RhoGAP-domain-containing protein [Daedalea quercina L-15889]
MHYPHLSRSRDIHPHASSSSSLSSNAPSDILPAAPPSDSSQSDIATDLSRVSVVYNPPPATFPAKSHRFFAKALTQRSTSMGQVLSPTSVVSPPRPASPSNGGGRFKHAFGRRKKSEDLTAIFSSAIGKGKERGSSDYVPPGASTSDLSHTTSSSRAADSTSLRNNKLPHALQAASNKLNVYGKQKTTGGQSPKAPTFSGAPPPPPKEAYSSPPLTTPQTSLRQPRHDANAPLPALPKETQRSPVSAATSPMQESRERLKEDWRKSDSTMTSHVTIRPGALAGNRSPRPVSLAESSHSGHTIVPVNKRLSALITDSEFNVVEEGPGDHSDDDSASHADDEGLVRRTGSPRPRPSGSPSGSIKTRNRRSMSLNVGPGHRSSMVEPVAALPGRLPSVLGAHSQGVSIGAPSPSLSTTTSSRDNPTLTRAAASGYIAPLNTVGVQQSTGSNIRSRLVPWMSASAGNTPTQAHPGKAIPVQSKEPSSLRQTAVSMTGGLAPAAGIAMGLGKRAVERVGRAWGGFGSSSGPSSGASTISQSSSVSSVTSSDQGHVLGRTMSKESSAAFGGIVKKKRRFGPAPSVSSVTSSSAASEADAFLTTGPGLGRRVRGPKRTPSGASVIGGLVFKRDLQTCVAETAIDGFDKTVPQEGVGMKPLEQRMLPALVVRCAQHLLKYGVREEGLFRISGRSSHVAKLRSEFDTGADWDMTECDPCDLDPHAVASIFKTYLRELPESILTMSLIPYFESALAAEDRASRASTESSTDASVKSSAASHQRSGSSLAVRKAPSLSTLAVPKFHGKRSVSDSLLKALAWLISRMPRENKDLLYTVIELVKETAAHSAETKMPLANLLLLFSPTLNMNPGMLRVLCEHDDIWQGAPQGPPEDETPDPEVSRASSAVEDEDSDEVIDIRATFVTARESTGSMGESSASGPTAQEPPSSRDEAEEDVSDGEDESSLHTPEESPERSTVEVEEPLGSGQTLKVDHRTAQVVSDLVLLPPISPVSPVSLGDDNASFMSALEPQSSSSTRSASPHLAQDVPPLSSSESLTSPSETSEEPLSPHGRPSMDAVDDEAPEASNVKMETAGQRDSFFLAPSPSEELQVDLSLPTAHRPSAIITNLPDSPAPSFTPAVPVPFPSASGSAPVTPISRRKSFALLSFPGLRSASESPSTSNTNSPASVSTPPSTWHRPKRPSLHLLLQKVTGRPSATPISSQPAMASVPTLSVYSQSKLASASVPSLSTPSPTVEAGHTRTLSNVAPKLETTISSSPIRLSFADAAAVTGNEQSSTDTSPSSARSSKIPMLNVEAVSDEPSPMSSDDSSRYVRPRAGSCATSLYVTPTGTTPKTPIADLYSQHSRSKSAMSFFNATDVDVSSWRAKKEDCDSLLPMSRSVSEAPRGMSPTPSIDLPVEETDEDWAASILMVARNPVEQEA